MSIMKPGAGTFNRLEKKQAWCRFLRKQRVSVWHTVPKCRHDLIEMLPHRTPEKSLP